MYICILYIREILGAYGRSGVVYYCWMVLPGTLGLHIRGHRLCAYRKGEQPVCREIYRQRFIHALAR